MKTVSVSYSVFVLGRGVGQVMFQGNAVSGLLMLVGIFLNSWQMGLLAMAGNVVSTLAAYFSGYDRDEIKNGLYGFNGTLVGIAVGVFMQLSVGALVMMVVASSASTWIAHLFGRQRLLPGFTAPFILSVWGLIGFCRWTMPDMLLASGATEAASQSVDCLQAFGRGIGQVMFQDNVATGLLFLAGILIHSRVAAAYTVGGALLPIPVAMCMGVDVEALNLGLMGYNGALCAIALGGKEWKSCAWATLSVLFSVVLQVVGIRLGLVTLTAPFVLAVWITMGLRRMAV